MTSEATKKPWLCRLGLHEWFNNTTGRNIGTEELPTYIMSTRRVCNRCGADGGLA